MPSKQFTCGVADGPINGQTEFIADFLGKCFVNYLLVNNVPENQLNPTCDFTHSYAEKKIKRGNPWVTGDKLIVDYTPCNNC